MPKISAIIITKNEVDIIGRCIHALQQVAAEIIVVDNYSTDGTAEVVRKMNVRLIQEQWHGYGRNKNIGNQKAKYNWILSIDADEVLSEELITTIQYLNLQKNTLYALNRLVNYEGKWIYHSGWHPDWKIRLFHKTNAQWDEHALVHEQLIHSPNLDIQKLSGTVYHYSYKNSTDHWEKIERYANLSARQMHKEGQKATFLKMYGSPIYRFIKTFFIKKGIFDGKLGWRISYRNAYLAYRKYYLLKQLNNGKQINIENEDVS